MIYQIAHIHPLRLMVCQKVCPIVPICCPCDQMGEASSDHPSASPNVYEPYQLYQEFKNECRRVANENENTLPDKSFAQRGGISATLNLIGDLSLGNCRRSTVGASVTVCTNSSAYPAQCERSRVLVIYSTKGKWFRIYTKVTEFGRK